MADTRPPRGRTRSLTVAALLGIFVAAVVLAIGGRLVSGHLTRPATKQGDTDRK
jgi:hypothetical protein